MTTLELYDGKDKKTMISDFEGIKILKKKTQYQNKNLSFYRD